jgi:16S rRNA (uracil1498-N3)-methyltransferase
MQRHRFYATPLQFDRYTVTLDSDESHHLSRVLRLSEGARVFVFDGLGNEWECEVSRVSRGAVELNLIGLLDDVVESPLNLILAQALIKGDKFDWVVQKATELGVTRIVPLITDHSDRRSAGDSAGRRLERWRRIAHESVKQCGRRRPVEITDLINFEDFCQTEAGKNNLIFSERGGLKPCDVVAKFGWIRELSLFVAPEGGWSDSEIELSGKSGVIPVHLGPRILRTETAAIAAVILAQHLFGDMK